MPSNIVGLPGMIFLASLRSSLDVSLRILTMDPDVLEDINQSESIHKKNYKYLKLLYIEHFSFRDD